jgi:hypothetical protein
MLRQSMDPLRAIKAADELVRFDLIVVWDDDRLTELTAATPSRWLAGAYASSRWLA